MRILITGGAGFVGGALARSFLHSGQGHEVVLLDNLKRRGSEWNLADLVKEGAKFVHGDVRNPADLESLEGTFDVLIEASAEPSVTAGIGGSPRYVFDTNLGGALNCLEYARRKCGGVVFLSSSRVYSLEPLKSLPLVRKATRLELAPDGDATLGASVAGISESFMCSGPRSYYGASKLAAEMLCQEYSAHAGLSVVINRCGVIAGAGQFGKTDQGVFTLWVARHYFGRPLRYTGFGGHGLQVRDLMHPDDLSSLLDKQFGRLGKISGQTFNVGGGRDGSASMQEFTQLCRDATAREVPIAHDPVTSAVDIPWYITDHRRASGEFDWQPRHRPKDIVSDIVAWLRSNEEDLAKIIS